MKTLEIQNPKKQRAKRNIIFAALMIFMCIIMISNAVSKNKNLNEENFEVVKGVVTNFEVLEEDYQFSIKVEEKKNVIISIKQETSDSVPKISENLVLKDEIILVYNKVSEESNEAYKVTINDKVLYNHLETMTKSNNRLIIFYVIIGSFFIAYAVYCVITFVKTEAIKEVTQVEYTITNNNAITNAMLKNESKSMSLIRREKLINKCVLIALVGILLLSIFIKSFINNKYILLAASAVIIIGLVTVMIVFKPRFHNKNLNIFVNDYIDYIKTGALKEERTLILTQEGMKVINEEQEHLFTYEDLNLFAVAVYSKTNAPVNIFICSNLVDKEEFKDYEDFIIPLSSDIYKDIIENNIEILGLENLLSNLYNETATNIKELKEVLNVKFYN
ncbi:MAG: hypothetical protein E7183_01970 [Erysipelotrichaceae bacterium]|nr:hypothetical protein [Erysipelotrichaceae bacterium]